MGGLPRMVSSLPRGRCSGRLRQQRWSCIWIQQHTPISSNCVIRAQTAGIFPARRERSRLRICRILMEPCRYSIQNNYFSIDKSAFYRAFFKSSSAVIPNNFLVAPPTRHGQSLLYTLCFQYKWNRHGELIKMLLFFITDDWRNINKSKGGESNLESENLIFTSLRFRMIIKIKRCK